MPLDNYNVRYAGQQAKNNLLFNDLVMVSDEYRGDQMLQNSSIQNDVSYLSNT